METKSIHGVGKYRHGTYFMPGKNSLGSQELNVEHIRKDPCPGATANHLGVWNSTTALEKTRYLWGLGRFTLLKNHARLKDSVRGIIYDLPW